MINLKEKIQEGKRILGLFSLIASPSVVEIAAVAGIDFVVIDGEHGPMSYESAQNMIMAAEAKNMGSIMRVAANRSDYILRALDIGANGVQIPHISTQADVVQAVKNAKYYPRGERGYTPFSRAGRYGAGVEEHAQNSNRETLVVANVEGIEGIKNIEDIIRVDDVDVIFIGPYDLSQSLGKPGSVKDPQILKEIKKTVELCKKSGKACGSFANDDEYLEMLVDCGVQYITYGVDTQLILKTFQGIQQEFQEKLKRVAHVSG